MSATLTNAEIYFAPTNHIKAAFWGKFEPEMKQAAIAQAKRDLSRKAQVADIETDLELPDQANVEYAIYEQAIWMLLNMPMTNADESFAVPTATDPETESNARKTQVAEIAPEAFRWLVPAGNITLSRG